MKCRICGSEKTNVLTSKLRRGNGTVYYCPVCDYGMLEPGFGNAEQYYDTEYRKIFKDVITETHKESPHQIYSMRKDYQGDRIKIISKYFDKNKSFLEIGSSAGQFLCHIIKEFKRVEGIEPDSSCAEYSKKLLVSSGG